MQMPRRKRYWFQETWTYIQIEGLSYYLETLYAQLGSMTEDFQGWMTSEAKKLPSKERDKFFESNALAEWYHENAFPRLFLNSFHLVAYSLLETEICSIADKIGKKQNQKFDVSETRGGRHLEPAIYYIKRLTGIDARDAKQFSCWPDLKDGQELRNIIAHSNGKVTEAGDITLATKRKVYDESRKEVKITQHYCESFVSSLRNFFAEMYKHLEGGDFL